MSMLDDNMNTTAVIAATAESRTQGPYKAVMVKKASRGLQLAWKMTDKTVAGGLGAFVSKVMPPAPSAQDNGSAPAGVLGLDCANVAFYRIDVPAVSDQKLASIVRMQAESLLPLPADQMQIAWRADTAENDKRSCSIAAARSDQLRQVAGDAGERASRILLNAEAVVKAWTELFDCIVAGSVLINIRQNDTQVLLTADGLLGHAVTLDVGAEELSGADATGDWELFVHDLRNALELFGSGGVEIAGIFVISEDVQAYEGIISYLKGAGIDAQPTVPASRTLRYGHQSDTPDESGATALSRANTPVAAKDICEYLEPIGLALMALDGDAGELNLFDGLLAKSGEDAKAKVALVLKYAVVITAILAVVYLAVGKVLDKAIVTRLAGIEVTNLIEQQNMKKLIASHRPDILGLITAITECGSSGMLLDSFDYKDGKVTIASFTKSREQMYEFQKKLEAKKSIGIGPVTIISPSFDEKKKRVNFKMQFEYKNPFKEN